MEFVTLFKNGVTIKCGKFCAGLFSGTRTWAINQIHQVKYRIKWNKAITCNTDYFNLISSLKSMGFRICQCLL